MSARKDKLSLLLDDRPAVQLARGEHQAQVPTIERKRRAVGLSRLDFDEVLVERRLRDLGDQLSLSAVAVFGNPTSLSDYTPVVNPAIKYETGSSREMPKRRSRKQRRCLKPNTAATMPTTLKWSR